MDRYKFNAVMKQLSAGKTSPEVSKELGVSLRIVQRIKEAGTWERWPYMVAKAQHGYNTPEYKAYLKRHGLPVTPPKRPTTITYTYHTVRVKRDGPAKTATKNTLFSRVKKWLKQLS